MRRSLFKSKIHRCRVTQADVDYEGSVTIDSNLLEAADILPNEHVHIWNVTRGTRLETYALRGEPDSGVICINGAAAHLMHPGDLVIIATFAEVEEHELKGWQPRVVLVDENNRIRAAGVQENPGAEAAHLMAFSTFIGVDLGGGKGKNTAVARLELVDGTPAFVEVRDYGTGKEAPWYDDRLLAYLREQPAALVAIDAPLTLPGCVRCQLSACPGLDACDVSIVRWFRERENGARVAGKKPKYTPYTQRATEVLLHEEQHILPRETLGQGMGPLTARAAYLTRALGATHRLNENLIEVYPKATLTQLFAARTAGRYKRSGDSPQTRLEILNALPDLKFAPGAWREHGLANDHKFDAVICAYTGYLWSRGACVEPPADGVARDDGWNLVPAQGELSGARLVAGVAVSALVAAGAWRRGSLSASGALAAVGVGALIFAAGGLGWFAVLGVFFVTSTLLGRVGAGHKAAVKREFEKGDTRDAWQVLANGGAAAVAALAMALWPSPRWADAFVAALAAANADTWATELGVLSRGEPWSLVRARRVPRGTSGAVSPLGLGAAAAGALAVGAMAAVTSPRPLHAILVAVGYGVAGALVDSLLGATLQERWRCPRCEREIESPRHHCGATGTRAAGLRGFGNDAVNAAATLAAAVAAAIL